MFTSRTRKAFFVLAVTLGGLGALGFAFTVRAQVPCKHGCYKTGSACRSPTTYRDFAGRVASSNFNDPGADPDKVADIVKLRRQYDWEDCEACPCKYVDCEHPCVGERLGGRAVSQIDRHVTTECVDETLGGGNSVFDPWS